MWATRLTKLFFTQRQYQIDIKEYNSSGGRHETVGRAESYEAKEAQVDRCTFTFVSVNFGFSVLYGKLICLLSLIQVLKTFVHSII